MKTKQIVIDLPESIYEELKEIADASAWKMEDVVLQTLRSGMPPSLGKVPGAFHEQLLALNGMEDRELLRVVEGDLPDPTPQDEQHKKADFDALRRTYALSLLKWRGHPIPPYEALG